MNLEMVNVAYKRLRDLEAMSLELRSDDLIHVYANELRDVVLTVCQTYVCIYHFDVTNTIRMHENTNKTSHTTDTIATKAAKQNVSMGEKLKLLLR